jgi:hypothetical protein
MEASDMLDVLHYLFEEDLRVASSEEIKSVEESRKLIYGTLYNRPYKYAQTKGRSTSNSGDNFDNFDPITPYTPNATKSYIPPTEFDPDSGLPGLIEPALG